MRKNANIRRGFNNHYLNINYLGTWPTHIVALIKDEGRQTNTKKAYTIPRWNTKNQLVVLVQVQTSLIKHKTR